MNLIKNTVINNDNLNPTEFYLSQNYPNPFSKKTSIKYCIAYKTGVVLQIFNTYGVLIKTLVNEEKDIGTYEFEFDPDLYQSLSGQELIEGIYICQLKAGDYSEQIEMNYSSKQVHNFKKE